MKNLTALLVILSSLSSTVLCQNFKIQLPPGYNRIVEAKDIKPGVEGSPYLTDNFMPGILKLWNGNLIEDLSYRYDIFHNEMQYHHENKIYIIGAPDSIRELAFANKQFIYLDFSKKEEGPKGYFEVLSSGKAVLLSRHFIEIAYSNYNIALNTGNKNDQLLQKETFYILRNNILKQVDRKGKNLTDIFTDKYSQLIQYSKKTGLSFRNKEDLKKIVEYFNGLL